MTSQFWNSRLRQIYPCRVVDTCQDLAEGGYWQNKDNLRVWQPPSCTLGRYSATSVDSCLRNERIVLIGDSTVRQVYYSIGRRMDPAFRPNPNKHKSQQTKSLTSNLTIEFIWDPYLNTRYTTDLVRSWINGTSSPGLALLGGGLHYAAHVRNPITSFKTQLDKLFQGQPASLTGLKVYLAPILPTEQNLIKTRPSPKNQNLIPAIEDPMNDYLKQKFGHGGADQQSSKITTLWSFNEQTYKRPDANTAEGIHVKPEVNEFKADILLNHYCNERMNAKREAPLGATCCTKPARKWAPKIFLLLIFSLAVIMSGMIAGVSISTKTIRAIANLVAVCCLAFMTDRTEVFGKLTKAVSQPTFVTYSLAIIVGGLMADQIHSKFFVLKSTKSEESSFLSRSQTDEWKGWMQALILVYHWTGTSKISWTFRLMRMLVASYLFMTGYGNARYYLSTGDFSLQRLLQQVVRLNILAMGLSYTLQTPYMDYYFAPLVTFWTLMVYIMVASFTRWNNKPILFVAKILGFTLIIFLALTDSTVTTVLLSPLRSIFKMKIDALKFYFRVKLDRLIVPIGVLFGFASHQLEEGVARSRSTPGHFLTRQSCAGRIVLTLASTVILASWIALALLVSSNDVYNTLHPYVSALPILAFVYLRNSTTFLRQSYSYSFARLGRCSLETFILQFHIFLGDDTHATLNLRLNYFFGRSTFVQHLNFVVLFLVLCVCSEDTAKATSSLIKGVFKTTERNQGQSKASSTGYVRVPIDIEAADDPEPAQALLTLQEREKNVENTDDSCEAKPRQKTRAIFALIFFSAFLIVLNWISLFI